MQSQIDNPNKYKEMNTENNDVMVSPYDSRNKTYQEVNQALGRLTFWHNKKTAEFVVRVYLAREENKEFAMQVFDDCERKFKLPWLDPFAKVFFKVQKSEDGRFGVFMGTQLLFLSGKKTIQNVIADFKANYWYSDREEAKSFRQEIYSITYDLVRDDQGQKKSDESQNDNVVQEQSSEEQSGLQNQMGE